MNGHLKNRRPRDPDVLPIGEWLPANVVLFRDFRVWLQAHGYGQSAVSTYGTAARMALGWLDKPYWEIDPQSDLDDVVEYIESRFDSAGTRQSYGQGIAKLTDFLRERRGEQMARRAINWDTYVGPLPEWLADDVRAYVAHRARTWLPENRHQATLSTLSHLTHFLRWAAELWFGLRRRELADLTDITPDLWYDYLDERILAGRSPVTVNIELYEMHQFLRFFQEQGCRVCERTLRVTAMKQSKLLPRDVPIDDLRKLLREIEREAGAESPRRERAGTRDRAWVLLMLHCGLRTGEIRRLRFCDVDLARERIRVEQSKGLKDRVVPLSGPSVGALEAHLALRRPAGAADRVFTYRGKPLTVSYCYSRLRTYGRRCGVEISPHQLRHSCATLLLNAGAPVTMVQRILGHRHIDTTLRYARLYDSTVAKDYYLAMDTVESCLELAGSQELRWTGGHLLALVASLQGGTLSMDQQTTVRALRTSILDLLTHPAEVI